jgi:folate-binding protein YgfZ
MSNYFIETPGYLEMSGEDGVDFLQRQTTNDVHRFDGKSALVTILTSPKARILDVLTLLPDPNILHDEAKQRRCMHILTLPNYSTRTVEFLTNRIFFMDKVSIMERNGEFVQIELFGSGADLTISKIGFGALPEPAEILSTEIDGCLLRVVGRVKELHLGCRLLVPPKIADDILDLIEDSGANPVTEEQYNVLRIEAGLPMAGYELTSDYTPLEIGLENVVSKTKGCYTGQEVIARQTNYDKVSQYLSGLKLSDQAQIGERVRFENKSVGKITSAAFSDRHGDIALAVIKRPHNQPGNELYVEQRDTTIVNAQIVELPFIK